MSQVVALLLAAGRSNRMGPINKLEVLLDGVALLRRSVDTLRASKLAGITVVVGHRKEESLRLLAGVPVKIVHNEHYAAGRMSSVHQGLLSLASVPADGVMICLADQPLLSAADLDFLLQAFESRGPARILLPSYRGRRGNPVLLDTHCLSQVLEYGPGAGCRQFIQDNPQLVQSVEVPNDHFTFDLDTPDDLAELRRRLDADRACQGF